MRRPICDTVLASAAFTFCVFATPVWADCGIEKGSIRILSNDFDGLRLVTQEAAKCASAHVSITSNLTTEHKALQVPALKGNPAQYTVALIANNSIVPLLNESLIQPLDDLVAKYGGDLSASQLIKVDGKIMAIAFMANGQHLIYRKDVFEKAGLTAPKSYEEVLAAAQAIREQGLMKYPVIASYKAGWDIAAEFVNIYLGMGGAFFETGSAKVQIDNEQGLATLVLMKDLSEYMDPDYMTFDSDIVKKEMQASNSAITNSWGSMVGAMIDPKQTPSDVAENFALSASPTVNSGKIPSGALWWDGFSISKNISDDDAEASFKAMVYSIRPAVAKEHPNAATWLIKGFEPGPASLGILANVNEGALPYPMSPYMGLLHTALGNELSDFLQGRESADTALKDTEAAYTVSATEAGFLK